MAIKIGSAVTLEIGNGWAYVRIGNWDRFVQWRRGRSA